MKVFFYCGCIFLTCIAATCNKKLDCSQSVYSFEGNYKAYPVLDSIRIADTIWLESTISTQLNDLMRNQLVNYSGAVNLGMAVGYGELLGGNLFDPGGIPAANSFENILIKGTQLQSLNPEQTRLFRFIEQVGKYEFKLGIVPKKKGLLAISPGNAANVYTRSNTCDKASFNLVFANTNQHLYLYEQSRPGYTPSDYERIHMYCFKVY